MDRETEMTLAGFRFVFFATGGESASHMGIYLPDQKVLFSGDEIQGPTFPQLHSLRGTRPRDIERWFGAIDRMRGWDVEYLVPSHGQIIEGKAEVSKVLTYYRDAMQYVHDQSVRLINMGFTPDEIAETVKLPTSVVIEPWTTEYYGNVDVSVRNVYGGYISWWNGDPAELRPTPRMERARRTVEMMGGRDKVFATAEKAFFDGDAQWAAELTTPLIRLNKEDWPARQLKAAALRVIGYKQTSSSLRGFYLTGARELDGLVDPAAVQRKITQQIFNLDDAPTSMVLENLRFAVNPERANGKQLTVGYQFADTGESFTLQLRNSVLEITPSLPDRTAPVVQLTRAFGNRILRGEETLQSGMDSGAITVRGNPAEVKALHSVFDRPQELPTRTSRCGDSRFAGDATSGQESEMINRRKLLQTLPAAGLLAAAGPLAGRDVHASASSPPAPSADIDKFQWRAIEAMIWGMPAVNLELMRQAMLEGDPGTDQPDPLLVGAARLEVPDADA